MAAQRRLRDAGLKDEDPSVSRAIIDEARADGKLLRQIKHHAAPVAAEANP